AYTFALARLNPDGSRDLGFGLKNDGRIVSSFPWGSSEAAGVVVQPADGKIVVAGSVYNGSNWDFGVARYNPDGSLDASFGGGGVALVDFGGASAIDWATAVALQPDGKIIVVGYTGQDPNEDFAVCRLTSTGLL